MSYTLYVKVGFSSSFNLEDVKGDECDTILSLLLGCLDICSRRRDSTYILYSPHEVTIYENYALFEFKCVFCEPPLNLFQLEDDISHIKATFQEHIFVNERKIVYEDKEIEILGIDKEVEMFPDSYAF